MPRGAVRRPALRGMLSRRLPSRTSCRTLWRQRCWRAVRSRAWSSRRALRNCLAHGRLFSGCPVRSIGFYGECSVNAGVGAGVGAAGAAVRHRPKSRSKPPLRGICGGCIIGRLIAKSRHSPTPPLVVFEFRNVLEFSGSFLISRVRRFLKSQLPSVRFQANSRSQERLPLCTTSLFAAAPSSTAPASRH